MVLCFSILFLHLYQIHTFKNSVNDEEMLQVQSCKLRNNKHMMTSTMPQHK